jgi:nitrate reductase NapE component
MLNDLFRGMDDDERKEWRTHLFAVGCAVTVVAVVMLIVTGVVWLMSLIVGPPLGH